MQKCSNFDVNINNLNGILNKVPPDAELPVLHKHDIDMFKSSFIEPKETRSQKVTKRKEAQKENEVLRNTKLSPEIHWNITLVSPDAYNEDYNNTFKCSQNIKTPEETKFPYPK